MTENWIVPANIKAFDIITHFMNSDTVIWHNGGSIKKGDYVYIYVGSPYSRIKYKCKVVEDAVAEDVLNDNLYAKKERPIYEVYSIKKDKYMKLRLLWECDDDRLSFHTLKEHDLGQVQKQARTSRKLQSYINEIEKGMKNNEE